MLGGRGTGRGLTAVVLAAGASSRFLGLPKACLRVGDDSAVGRITGLASAAGASPVVVVVGPHEEAVRRALSGRPVDIAVNADWFRGRTGSVHTGLRRVPAEDDILLWPVDHPFVNVKSLHALGLARERDPLALWFIPMFRGQGGHPVVIRAEARRAIEALPADAPLKTLPHRLGPQVRRVSVDDPGVTANADTPETFQNLRTHWEAGWIDA